MSKLIIILTLFILSGCNAHIGIPNQPGDQPWATIHLITLVVFLVLPFVSTFLLVKSNKMDLEYKVKLQSKLNKSLFLVLILWVISEMSIPQNTNIRIDLFIVLPAIAVHVFAVFMGYLNLKKEP